MKLFATEAPRVFAVPPGAAFADAFAAGLRARLDGRGPEALARVEVLLNTRRARRALEAAFEAGTAATYLPRIRTLDDLADDPLTAPDLPPAVDPTRRRLTLTRLVAAFLARRPDLGPEAAAPAHARALAALLDEMQREGVALSALDAAAPPEHARHWDETLRFLAILRDAWPAILAEQEAGALDPEARRRAAIETLVEDWRAAPPAAPTIAAGSTGSVATTALLLAAVARLPDGAVVLPGFDPERAADVWPAVGPEHPWGGMKRLLDGLGLAPGDVALWSPDAPESRPRRRLLAEALRPAPATDGWLAARATLAVEAETATAGLSLIEAPDPRREATAIALALREAVETPGRRAALVTPDRTLARRVASTLLRWGVEADDSGGRPLALTPPGVFLKLVADVAFGGFDAVTLLALLKHPLAQAGDGRGEHLAATRRFELAFLRRRPELASLRALHGAFPDPETPFAAALGALAALGETTGDLAALAAAHRRAAEAVAGPALWEKAAGEAARAAVDAFVAAAPVYGDCAPAAYPALFADALDGEVREEAFRPDPRVAIWGPLEARMQSADLVVLGGLVEGVWPATPSPDPWLSRPMRARVGLPSPERRIGLAAHDVLSAACAPRALLTRSLRAGGAPAAPSRWLARLTTLLGGAAPEALDAMRARGAVHVAMADALERPAESAAPAPRPCPKPPVAARPQRLSATAVETLIRDPYAVYARHVLRLFPLDPVSRDIDARDRGLALHDALRRFVEATPEWPADPAPAFRAAIDAALAEAHAPEALRRLWRARLERLAPILLAEEAARRAAGRPLALEAAGERSAGAFTLTARADRIDRLTGGGLALYDYKTGRIPTDAEIAAFSKQLPLEAAIAVAGGFAEAGDGPVATLAHISLGGGKGGGATTPVKGEAAALAAEAWDGLLRLIACYDAPDTGYAARARPQRLRYASDYDHLARFGEWEDGG
ncbi:MAG: double-strand break repair protein AddB [Rhodobacteraceae bacterium]|nr:MAG: double-strand break repair protein AddB [Paracoccaceae bacterium]